MTRENYCTYQQCEKLKFLGFNWPVNICYRTKEDGSYWINRTYHAFDFNKVNETSISVPTTAVALRWFRDVHNLTVIIDPSRVEGDAIYTFAVYSLDSGLVVYVNFRENNVFNTFEMAELAAVNCLLEMLHHLKTENYERNIDNNG